MLILPPPQDQTRAIRKAGSGLPQLRVQFMAEIFSKKFPRAPCQPLQNLPIREKSSPKNFRKFEKNVSLFSGGIDR